MFKLKFFKYFFFIIWLYSSLQACDLTIVGMMNYADGLGRIPAGLIRSLKDDLIINFIPIGEINPHALSQEVKEVVFAGNRKKTGKVSILTVPVFWSKEQLFYKSVPKSTIKIAYSMFESTRIPIDWVKILNQEFDAIIVPDPYLLSVYQKSGIQIPIFVIPLGMDLDGFLNREPHSKQSFPFVFGASATYSPRKNLALVIQAFARVFGYSKDVVLKIHGRYGQDKPFHDLVQSLGISNIIFSHGTLEQEEYIDVISSFDCYINLSKGEGFSCCPREALALGIPCILSNNTAQKTLCRTGFVKAVSSNIKESALYGVPYYDSQFVGKQFNCNLVDVEEALQDVYSNYEHYLYLAQLGRQWVEQYSWSNLKLKYLNLIKPKQLIFGDQNVVTDSYLMTDSLALYKKYRSLQ